MKPLAILLALTAPSLALDAIPKAFPKERYAETLKTSPFVIETKVEAPTPEVKISPFQNLYLRGIGKADGKDYVLVQRLGEERTMRFIGNEPGPDGITVKSVRQGDHYRETRVILQRGVESGEVGFKEDSINSPPPAPGGNKATGPAAIFPKPGGGPPGGVPFPQVQVPANRTTTAPPMPGSAVPRPTTAVPTAPAEAPKPSGNSPFGGRGGTQFRGRSGTIRN